MAEAMDMIEILSTELKRLRENSEEKFHVLFSDAQELAKQVGGQIVMPRITNRQTFRANYNTDSAEEYYRLSIFIPFLDHFIIHLQDRFLNHKAILSKIQNVLPKKIVNLNENSINETVDVILTQWSKITDENDNIVKKEALLWKLKWEKINEKPETFIDSLCECNISIFPNVYKILQVCATIPVTVATVERSFSTLKRIKTYLRNSTIETRLNGLATISIHREIKIDTERIIDKFCEKNRKLVL